MDEISAAQCAEQQRPVEELCDQGAEVLHLEQTIERRRRNGIYWNDPCLHGRIACPPFDHPLRLDRLSAEDAERGDHDGNTDRAGRGGHTAGFWLRPMRCKTDDLSRYLQLNSIGVLSKF